MQRNFIIILYLFICLFVDIHTHIHYLLKIIHFTSSLLRKNKEEEEEDLNNFYEYFYGISYQFSE